MGPKSKCTNCGVKDWMKSQHSNFIPQLAAQGGSPTPDDGLHVNMWMCKNCWYLVAFGSAD